MKSLAAEGPETPFKKNDVFLTPQEKYTVNYRSFSRRGVGWGWTGGGSAGAAAPITFGYHWRPAARIITNLHLMLSNLHWISASHFQAFPFLFDMYRYVCVYEYMLFNNIYLIDILKYIPPNLLTPLSAVPRWVHVFGVFYVYVVCVLHFLAVFDASCSFEALNVATWRVFLWLWGR